MQWFNLHLPLLKSDEFSEAEPWEIGVWLRLMAYCCEQENGGQILGCADWSAKKWLVTCGVDKDDLQKESQLWTWAVANPGVLWVHQYPGSVEDRVRKARYCAKKGGLTRTPARAAASAENGKKGGRPRNNLAEPSVKDKGKDKVIPVSFDACDESALEPEKDDGMA